MTKSFDCSILRKGHKIKYKGSETGREYWGEVESCDSSKGRIWLDEGFCIEKGDVVGWDGESPIRSFAQLKCGNKFTTLTSRAVYIKVEKYYTKDGVSGNAIDLNGRLVKVMDDDVIIDDYGPF